MGKWKRPDSVPFPNVWHRFEGKKKINGVLPKFWVQDIPEDLYETAVELMGELFPKDEPLGRYSRSYEDPVGVQRYKQILSHGIKDRLGLICFMENPDPNGKPIIAGMNITALESKDDKDQHPELDSDRSHKILGVMKEVYKEKDPYEELGINECLGAFGLIVIPEFRGQAIGLEILKARIPLCKAVGLRATLTVFTSIASQKLAERCGFRTLTEISFEELERRNPKFRFPNIQEHTKSIKLMYLLIN